MSLKALSDGTYGNFYIKWVLTQRKKKKKKEKKRKQKKNIRSEKEKFSGLRPNLY